MHCSEEMHPLWATNDNLSFNSRTSDGFSFTSSSSSARSSTVSCLSFNDRLITCSTPLITRPLPHHTYDDPNWSSIINSPLQLRHLNLIRHLGTGNLSRVFLCRLADDYETHHSFALKVVDRDALSPKKLTQAITEADILSSLDHPFLPNLYARFDVSHYTCLLIDYCPGGDLHSLLRNHHPHGLPLSALKFVASEILVALEYLHSLGIVYRDLKPENILLRGNGHIMLSDFDLCFKSHVVPKLNLVSSAPRRNPLSCFSGSTVKVSREFVAEPTEAKSNSCVGTHEYLAPEFLNGNGHGNGVDWWAFGVLLYELMYGITPFKGATKEATLRNIGTKKLRFPNSSSTDKCFVDLVEKLLVKDPKGRLGCNEGATELKKHPFFKGIKWSLIRNYKPPNELSGFKTNIKSRRWWNKNKNKKNSAPFQLPLWSAK